MDQADLAVENLMSEVKTIRIEECEIDSRGISKMEAPFGRFQTAKTILQLPKIMLINGRTLHH